jgi:hypothetical protein
MEGAGLILDERREDWPRDAVGVRRTWCPTLPHLPVLQSPRPETSQPAALPVKIKTMRVAHRFSNSFIPVCRRFQSRPEMGLLESVHKAC